MSVFGSMTTAVSGIAAQARALGNLSDNIANSQTVGYKRVETSFQSLVTTSTADLHSPGGVRARPSYTNSLQGNISQTENTTNMAITGNGFFQVSSGTEGTDAVGFSPTPYYTRAGDFSLDRFGYLKNSGGMYLNGWGVDATGELNKGSVSPIRIQQLIDTPSATKNITMSANLPLTPTSANLPTQSVTVVDDTGLEHQINLSWRQQATGDWRVNIDAPGSTTSPTAGTLPSTIVNGTALGAPTQNTAAVDPVQESTDVTIGAVSANTVYTVNVNNRSFSYTATAADVLAPNNVAKELYNQIIAATAAPGGAVLAGGVITLKGDTAGNGLNIITTPAASLTANTTTAAVLGVKQQVTVPVVGPAGGIGDDYQVDWGGAPTIHYVSTGKESNPKDIASGIAAQINANSTSPVTATVSGSQLVLTAKTANTGIDVTPTVQETPGYLKPYIHMQFNGGYLQTMDAANAGTGNATVSAGQAPGDDAFIQFDVNYGNGVQTVKMNLGKFGAADGLTQFKGTDLVTNSVSQDGFTRGTFHDLEIKTSGDVVANYDNGRSRVLARVPVVQVTNPDAMQKTGGNAFEMTREAGGVRIGDASENGAGNFSVSAVESSNVDIAQEFTKMIVTQRAYTANTKVVTTADEMLTETMGMKR